MVACSLGSSNSINQFFSQLMIGLATLVVTDPIFEPVAVNFIDPVLPHRLDAEWAAEA